jgi:hypothetical protein
VATRLGNSVKVLNGHYLNVIKADDCAEFWSLHAERLTVEEIDYWQDFALHYAKTAL